MGMPSTKAECEKQIAWNKTRIAHLQAQLHTCPPNSKSNIRTNIAQLKGEIAHLQAHKKTLK